MLRWYTCADRHSLRWLEQKANIFSGLRLIFAVMVAVDIDLCFFCFFQTEIRWTRHLFFSRMRSEGFSFYLWGSGGGGVFARRRVFMFATVRNRSQLFAGATAWRKLTVPRGKVAKGIVFVRFQRDVAAFSVAGVALRDMLVESCRTYGKRCKKRCL